MTEERCGHPTLTDDPCKHPVTEDDGLCWIHTDEDSDSVGRPSKLEAMDDVERAQFIGDVAHVIEQGGSIREACRKVGIHRETFGNWMQRGEEQEDGPYREFFDRLVRARGEGEGTYRQALMQIAIENDDTPTLLSMLKQRYPESWADVDRPESTGGVTVNVGESDEYEVDPETLEVVSGGQ